MSQVLFLRLGNTMLRMLCLGGLFFSGLWVGLKAEVYPVKPVRVLVGYPPGAGSDIVTRLITP